jgi:hypothetical protein
VTPRRVGETGHQVIPSEVADHVGARLAEFCRRLGPALVGITSLAAGADQMFAEAVLASGGQLHVVVPSRNYERSFEAPEDLRRFEQLLARARTFEALDFDRPSEPAYLAAGKRVVDLSDELVAIWDQKPARGVGGTGDIVLYAEGRNLPVTIVWLEGVER